MRGPAPHDGLRAALLAGVLVLGAFGAVLAGTSSPLFDLDRHAVPKELVLHTTAWLALVLMLTGVQRFEIGITGLLLIAFTAWSTLTAIPADNHWLAFRSLGITLSSVIAFAAARRVAHAGHASIVITGLSAAATVAAALGAAQAWGLEWEWLAGSRPPGGTFGNRNFLAHLLAIATPALVFSCLLARRRTAALMSLAGLMLVAGTVVLTRSRAAWLGLACGLAVTTLGIVVARRRLSPHHQDSHDEGPHRDPLRARLLRMAAALVAGVLLATLLPNRLEWRSDSPYSETLAGLANYREGSGRGRLVQYQNTLELVRESPVPGKGPGNWFIHYPRVTAPGDPAFAGADPIPTNPWPSSDWIAFLAERGIPGTLLLLFAGGTAALTAVYRLWTGDALRGPGHGDRSVIFTRDRPASRHHPAALADASSPWPAATHTDPLAGSSSAADLEHRALAPAALLGTLAAVIVTGLFDAVLLLAAPSFYVFALTGLLLPTTRPVVSLEPRQGVRRSGSGALVLLSLALIASSAGQLTAMRLAGDGRNRESVERALRYDPGNHRLHLLLARRGTCRQRAPHALAAAALMPYHPSTAAALRACGLTRD
ncbi:MAG: O-antigen ligase family protein [Gemmatimonadetes bacterium]|nr:O-antigen ligase family protein [Gemmatimonadota bacterium]